MAAPVGLLLVHGIGMQRRGETLDGFLSGMRLAYGERLVVERVDAAQAILSGLGRPVHVFEVYWADLLHGEDVKGTFDANRIHETVWFPLLNHSNGRLPPRAYPRVKVLAHTWSLAVLGVLVASGLMGAKMLASAGSGAVRPWRERQARGTRPVTLRESWRRVWRRDGDREGSERRRTWLDDVLDQVVGDVFNYVHGVARAFPADTERNRKLAVNVSQIRTRFLGAAEQAQRAGCDEVQVLAHSLGTVVAFLGLCPDAPVTSPVEQAGRLTRFHTIGSPLERVRFFWSPLVACSPNGPVAVLNGDVLAAGRSASHTMRWDNFFSPFDLVSSPLDPFEGWPEPANHSAAGLGGLMSAHVAYNRNPGFLAFVGEALTGERPMIAVPLGARVIGRIRAIGETLLLPLTILGLSMLGFVIMVGFAWGLGSLIGCVFEWAGLPTLARIIRYYMPASIFFIMSAGAVIVGRANARELYAKHWT